VSTEVNFVESQEISFRSSVQVRLRDQHPETGFDSRQLHKKARSGPSSWAAVFFSMGQFRVR
jgi:hypothetical protein